MPAPSPAPAPARPRRRLLVLSVVAAVLLLLVVLLWGRQTASVLLMVTAVLGLVVGIVRVVRRRGWRWLATGAVALVLAVGLAPAPTDAVESDTAGAAPSPTATGEPTTTPSTSASATPGAGAPAPAETAAADPSAAPTVVVTEDSTAAEVLGVLAVKGRSARTGYDRNLFRWNGHDLDRNGCDQRNDVLARDLTGEEIRPGSNGCYVLAGMLQDRYAGTASWVERDDVDIDHVVALSNAWQTGASGWDEDRMVRFANDPLNLVATDDALNQQKGDGDAATWLPPARALRCEYVARQIAVKHTYQLWVTPPERDAMQRILTDCPDQTRPAADDEPEPMSRTVAPRPEPEQTVETEPADDPEPVDAPEPLDEPEVEPTVETEPVDEPEPSDETEGAGDVYYENCDAVRAAGADPIHAGDPGYASHLDGDSDGVDCES